MESTLSAAMLHEIEGNKENTPPAEEKKVMMMKMKKKNPIPIVAPSFKKKGNSKTSKRVPLADITDLFCNSNGGSAVPSSSSSESVLLNSIPRRRKMVVATGSKSKTLRLGFR